VRYELDCYTTFWMGGGFQKLFKGLDTQLKYKCAIRVQNLTDSNKVISMNYVPFFSRNLFYNTLRILQEAGIGQGSGRDRLVGTAARQQVGWRSVRILVEGRNFPPEPKGPHRPYDLHILLFSVNLFFSRE